MTTLLDSLVLTLKLLYKKYDHRTINELKYIILVQRVVIAHNVTHLFMWSINLVLLQI
jgi:hypothetical protein